MAVLLDNIPDLQINRNVHASDDRCVVFGSNRHPSGNLKLDQPNGTQLRRAKALEFIGQTYGPIFRANGITYVYVGWGERVKSFWNWRTEAQYGWVDARYITVEGVADGAPAPGGGGSAVLPVSPTTPKTPAEIKAENDRLAEEKRKADQEKADAQTKQILLGLGGLVVLVLLVLLLKRK